MPFTYANLTCCAAVGDWGLLEPWGNTRASTVFKNNALLKYSESQSVSVSQFLSLWKTACKSLSMAFSVSDSLLVVTVED